MRTPPSDEDLGRLLDALERMGLGYRDAADAFRDERGRLVLVLSGRVGGDRRATRVEVVVR